MRQILSDILTDPITIVLTCVCVVVGAVSFMLVFAKVVIGMVTP